MTLTFDLPDSITRVYVHACVCVHMCTKHSYHGTNREVRRELGSFSSPSAVLTLEITLRSTHSAQHITHWSVSLAHIVLILFAEVWPTANAWLSSPWSESSRQPSSVLSWRPKWQSRASAFLSSHGTVSSCESPHGLLSCETLRWLRGGEGKHSIASPAATAGKQYVFRASTSREVFGIYVSLKSLYIFFEIQIKRSMLNFI